MLADPGDSSSLIRQKSGTDPPSKSRSVLRLLWLGDLSRLDLGPANGSLETRRAVWRIDFTNSEVRTPMHIASSVKSFCCQR